MAAVFVLSLLLGLAGSALSDHSDVAACKYTDDAGMTYDLSPLRKQDGYMWNQTVFNTAGNMLTNPDFSNPVQLMFQLQVCGNISKPMHANKCNVTAPVYMYNPADDSCVSLGRLEVSTFLPNPFKDGVHLRYFLGDALNHIDYYQASVYFVCDATKEIVGPVFEHLKDSYQAHFHVITKHACKG